MLASPNLALQRRKAKWTTTVRPLFRLFRRLAIGSPPWSQSEQPGLVTVYLKSMPRRDHGDVSSSSSMFVRLRLAAESISSSVVRTHAAARQPALLDDQQRAHAHPPPAAQPSAHGSPHGARARGVRAACRRPASPGMHDHHVPAARPPCAQAVLHLAERVVAHAATRARPHDACSPQRTTTATHQPRGRTTAPAALPHPLPHLLIWRPPRRRTEGARSPGRARACTTATPATSCPGR